MRRCKRCEWIYPEKDYYWSGNKAFKDSTCRYCRTSIRVYRHKLGFNPNMNDSALMRELNIESMKRQYIQSISKLLKRKKITYKEFRKSHYKCCMCKDYFPYLRTDSKRRCRCYECQKKHNEIHKYSIKKYNEIRKQSKEYKAEYYRKNKERMNAHSVKYSKKRYREDGLFRISSKIRSLIRSSIKRNGYEKIGRTREILGCDFETFKLYIERQFKKGMTWDNHGEWHLDHIYPVSLAKDEQHLIELNHYTNFQPLWAKENMSKGNKIIEHQAKIPFVEIKNPRLSAEGLKKVGVITLPE